MMKKIPEDHSQEQYFFDASTRDWLATVSKSLSNLAIVCCPSLSVHPLLQNRKDIRFFDMDTRFPRIEPFDLNYPKYMGEFDSLIIDPPFFNFPLIKIRKCVDIFLSHNYQKKVMIAYLTRRANVLYKVFPECQFQFIRNVTYETVQNCDRNQIGLYANFPILLKNLL